MGVVRDGTRDPGDKASMGVVREGTRDPGDQASMGVVREGTRDPGDKASTRLTQIRHYFGGYGSLKTALTSGRKLTFGPFPRSQNNLSVPAPV